MDRRSFLLRAGGAACACGGGLGPALASESPPWSYRGQGGAAAWGSLSPDYATCSTGKEQSPINLTRPSAAILGDPMPTWRPVPLRVTNTGHTIEVDCDGGGGLTLEGTSYELRHLHFHHPSEHTLEGATFDMECHFDHIAADGAKAEIGVMIAKGAANPALEAIWQVMPATGGETATAPGLFDPATLLPKDPISYRYAGSLTTPPCSEVVQWVVYRQAVTASAEQLERFARLFPDNARPVQPINRRKLLLDIL
jgi:carbonic anhydrase